jgi:hypothetical protein
MRKLSRSMRKNLAKWTDRSSIPEPGDRSYNHFFDLYGELTAIWDDEDLAPESKLTATQHGVAALITFGSAVPTDGICVGVVVNEQFALPQARLAAESFGLTQSVSFLDAVISAIPPEVLASLDQDVRIVWYEANTELAQTIDELADSEEGRAALTEMMLTAMNTVAQHPEEFFE